MGDRATFKERLWSRAGLHAWLREKIAAHDFTNEGVVSHSEIFVSDGSKYDNILDIFGDDAIATRRLSCVCRRNVMAGHTGTNDKGEYEGLVWLCRNYSENNNHRRDSCCESRFDLSLLPLITHGRSPLRIP